MKITEEEVKQIAKLSRLYLGEEEVETFQYQLNTIIEYVEQLNAIDTSKAEITSHVMPLKNAARDDTLAPSIAVEDALKNAPDSTEGFYRVPKIIE